MSCVITPFENKHLEEASHLVARQVELLRQQVSSLPGSYSNPHHLQPLIQAITSGNPGVAAQQDGRLAGFLTAWQLPSFQGAPAVFTPELAHAAIPQERARIYDQMYAALAETWVAAGYRTHLISLMANDHAGLEAWNHLGFGMLVADGLRDLQALPEPPSTCEIRRAQAQDAEIILVLDTALDDYLGGSPTFIKHGSEHSISEVEGWITNAQQAFWIAWDGPQPVAFIGFGPASHDASMVIVDDQTASISAAYTLPTARSQGIATALLNRGLAWAHAQGYSRCAVDFEMTNPLARRFWLRYFQPVSYSLCRTIF